MIAAFSITPLGVAQRTDMTFEMEDGKLTGGDGVEELAGASVPS